MRGPPALFERDLIAFSCFKMAGCLSEEELEIAISLNGSFVAVFSSCPRTILKHNFKFATKYEFNSEFCISIFGICCGKICFYFKTYILFVILIVYLDNSK
jgi:hypothetical protein